jgi:phosphonate degradation associated HDIG domain protein
MSIWHAWEQAGDADAACAALRDGLLAHGGTRYDPGVTQLEHALQSAALARAEGAPDALVIAALLHDVGHLLLDEHERRADFLGDDRHHEAIGARFLARWLPPAVTTPVALHVRAKRYLVRVDPAYASGLSEASTASLALQGGPLRDIEARAFEQQAHVTGAIAVRRWDDRAKVPGRAVEGLEAYLRIVRRLMSHQPPCRPGPPGP